MSSAHVLTEEERHYYSLNRKAWPWFAPIYDFITSPMKRLRQIVVQVAELPPGSRILDVATGTGEQALAFAATAGEVVGIDISGSMLRVANRKPRPANVSFREADATDLPFNAASFDAACVSFGLHEMPRSIRERVVREMVRVTKPGGRIVVVDYALPENTIARKVAYHIIKLYERDSYAEFARSDLNALLESCGIAVETEQRALRGGARVVVGRTVEDAVNRQPSRSEARRVNGSTGPGTAP